MTWELPFLYLFVPKNASMIVMIRPIVPTVNEDDYKQHNFHLTMDVKLTMHHKHSGNVGFCTNLDQILGMERHPSCCTCNNKTRGCFDYNVSLFVLTLLTNFCVQNRCIFVGCTKKLNISYFLISRKMNLLSLWEHGTLLQDEMIPCDLSTSLALFNAQYHIHFASSATPLLAFW